jgi:hypothetical protein
MKILFTISTGWAIRNYIQTGVLSNLANSCELIILTKAHFFECIADALHGIDVKIEVIETFEETLSWRYLRQSKKKIHLHRFESTTEEVWERYVQRPIYQRVGALIIRGLGRLLGYDHFFSSIEKIGLFLFKNSKLDKLVKEYAPDIIFLTHQANSFDEQLYYLAKGNGIKLMYMVLSWDHLSSKVYLGSYFDKIFVWNDWVAEEILSHSGYKRNEVEIVGIPQFDVYSEKPSVTYADWCLQFEFDSNKKTILFSTMPQVRHDQQHLIIEEIAEKINCGAIENCQLLIKCHPFDDWQVYSHLKKYGKIISIIKANVKSSADQDKWIPSKNFMIESRDALYYCSVNINIFSTITIEAALFDKPIINIGYDPRPDIVKNRIPCIKYYEFKHFKPIVSLNASVLVVSGIQLVNEINNALINPGAARLNRLNLANKYVPKFSSSSALYLSNRVLNALNE